MLKNAFLILILLQSFVANTQTQFEDFCAKYDTLTTICGKGEIREKGVNGWEDTSDPLKAELSRPHFAMADYMGRIFIADKDADAVRVVFNYNGKYEFGYGMGTIKEEVPQEAYYYENFPLKKPNGLFAIPFGGCYVLDLGSSSVYYFNPDYENYKKVFTDPEGISIGRGLWVMEDTIFFCSNSRIRLWTKNDGVSTYADGFKQLGNIYLDDDRNLYVTDRGADKVYMFDKQKNKTHIAGNGKQKSVKGSKKAIDKSLDGVRAVWKTEGGGLLLGCHENSNIYFLDTLGNIHKFLDGKNDHTHKGDGEHFRTKGNKVSEVRSVSMDYFGNIIICENDYGYVRMIKRKPNFIDPDKKYKITDIDGFYKEFKKSTNEYIDLNGNLEAFEDSLYLELNRRILRFKEVKTRCAEVLIFDILFDFSMGIDVMRDHFFPPNRTIYQRRLYPFVEEIK